MLCYRGKKSTSCSPSRLREPLPDGTAGLISSQTIEGKSEHFEGSILKQGLSGAQGSLSPSLRVVLCNGDSAIRIIFRNEFNPSSQFWLGWMLPRSGLRLAGTVCSSLTPSDRRWHAKPKVGYKKKKKILLHQIHCSYFALSQDVDYFCIHVQDSNEHEIIITTSIAPFYLLCLQKICRKI